MFKKILLATFLLSSSLFSSNFDSFKIIPIQEDGRVKPLDTFARNQLLRFYGKRSTGNDISPTNWLFGIAMNNDGMAKIPIFNIRNSEVAHTIGLDWDSNHKYTISEVSNGIQSQLDVFKTIYSKDEENLSLVEKQLAEIYMNVAMYKSLESSLLCLLPTITIDNQKIADAIKVNIGDKVSYFRFIQYLDNMNLLIQSYPINDDKDLSPSDSSFFRILADLNKVYESKNSIGLKIIPSSKLNKEKVWLSPWELMDGRRLEVFQLKMLLRLEECITNQMPESLLLYKEALYSESIDAPSLSVLKKEVWYNKVDLFYKSTALYVFGFIFLCLSYLFKPVLLSRLAGLFLLSGFMLHGIGLYLRMVIMARPPVTTLYESIIFVGFVAVFLSIIIELFKKDQIGILIGTISGAIFHFVSFGYAADGDTLGMLVAVLNSNFWLATHVTTMTMGYGVSIIAGIMGHIYLIYSIIHPGETKKLREIYDNTFGITILALFFTVFGTILGGIWADQSWGRFWGWDPKENGALLICMWQIFMIHLRLTGMVKGAGFCFGMVINIIIVTLAWFGVNLLSVGLHSYGFASGIALNLTLFILFELLLGGGSYYLSKKRSR
tara:strand:+ start:648 stop:2468 length:1821 start_codon:yes stop_codon:yes gene_type:complete